MNKLCVIGGGGLRTPLLTYGLVQRQAETGIRELALYDLDAERVRIMSRLAREIVRMLGGDLAISTPPRLEEAIEGAGAVISSIRVGGMEARARDERIAVEHGLAGQETTGPGGFAMALRTIPVALEHARAVEHLAPEAWLISFTNPAGCVTQALTTHTKVKAIGICDTPAELFHRIAWVLREPFEDLDCDYIGLNHLGWIRKVRLRGEDVTRRLLDDPGLLRTVHPTLFEPALLHWLNLIPTEYVYFYYSQRQAYANEQRAGATRGEELVRLNKALFDQLRSETPAEALQAYRQYLNHRNASYMRVEGEGSSAFETGVNTNDNPFEAASGYHRIAIQAIAALNSDKPSRLVLNVVNGGAVEDLGATDVVEVPCEVDRRGARPLPAGRLPEAVRGLVQSVKAFERLTIRAAVEQSAELARLALLVYPIVGDWQLAGELIEALGAADEAHLRFLAPARV